MLWKGFAIVLVLVLAWPGWLAYQVWDQSRQDELAPADAIVVLGAAQYQGRPSPVLRARLAHAAYLHREGFAEKLVVTGGKADGDQFTEAETGRRYLAYEGVPPEAILSEEEGRTSLQSLRNVAEMAEEEEIGSVLLVSDPMHSERIKRMAVDLGFDEAHASPANYQQFNRSREQKAKELLREVGSIMVYELLDK